LNEEQKSIQLEQRIIHLKSELEKYKTMLASFQAEQESNHLKEQIEQLTTENAQLKEKCHYYEETISTQNHKIDRLSTELEETKKENRLLHDEIQQLRSENFVFQKKVEANEEKIKSLLSDLSNYKQSQAELEKEKEITEEKNRVLMNEYLSFKSELESLTSWVERIKTMEKDYNFLKENSDKALRDFEDLKEVLFTRKKETEDLKEEVRILTKKLHAIEEMVSELDREKQKDMAFLQKHILHQHVEIETILEKTSHFAKEIEKISKQLSELTERMEQKSEDSSNSEMNEMKGMLSQLVQLLTPQQNSSYMEETTPSLKQPSIKKNAENMTSHTNSFLKLNEFINETQQSIVVTPISKKEQNRMNPQMSNIYPPQKSSQIKSVRIETMPVQNIPQQPRHQYPKDDDDKLPNSVIPTSLYTTPHDDQCSDEESTNYTLFHDISYDTQEPHAQLSAPTEEQMTFDYIETAENSTLLIGDEKTIHDLDSIIKEEVNHDISAQATGSQETNIHEMGEDMAQEDNRIEMEHSIDLNSIIQEDVNHDISAQATGSQETNIHEIEEDMTREDNRIEMEHTIENDDTNVTVLSESDTIDNGQKTIEKEIISPPYNQISLAIEKPLAQPLFAEEQSLANKIQEKEVENNKWRFLSLLRRTKIFK
jgi:myosin heavy subunit